MNKTEKKSQRKHRGRPRETIVTKSKKIAKNISKSLVNNDNEGSNEIIGRRKQKNYVESYKTRNWCLGKLLGL